MSKKIWIIMILLMSVSAIVIGNNTGIFESKLALKLVVTTSLDENNTVKITNITFEQTTVPFYYKRVDSPTQFPEINVFVKSNIEQAESISYWSAVKRTDDEGIYTLILIFRDGKAPKVNDTLILPIKLTDFKGKQIYRTTAFYGWTE
jgi:hypothetical protein